jgi:hypothetical protein
MGIGMLTGLNRGLGKGEGPPSDPCREGGGEPAAQGAGPHSSNHL